MTSGRFTSRSMLNPSLPCKKVRGKKKQSVPCKLFRTKWNNDVGHLVAVAPRKAGCMRCGQTPSSSPNLQTISEHSIPTIWKRGIPKTQMNQPCHYWGGTLSNRLAAVHPSPPAICCKLMGKNIFIYSF